MCNPLLIYANIKIFEINTPNTPIKNIAKNFISFSTDGISLADFDLDSHISQKIIPEIVKKEFNILFIKDNLSDNYLELYGITLAYHIRLSAELEDKRFVPIVIISDVDGYILNKLTPMANILFTKNTFVARNEIASHDYFEKVFEQIKSKPLNADNFQKEFLDLIHIDPPQDYLSHHDITNEWSIYRWAEFLKVDTDATKANKAKIENMLYFKYLKALYPITDYYIENDNEADLLIVQQQVKSSSLKIVKKVKKSIHKVLYIDDEWGKGWKDIFEKYFSKSQNIKFHFIDHQYKDTTYDAIEALVRDSLTSESIDTILLDMRLTKEDHEQKDVKEFSGIKLLNFIKSFNPGIQVILLTASEKSSILDEANKYNILGYIKKENPSDDSSYTKEVFKKLAILINLGFERKYLKNIWNIQKEVLQLKILENDQYSEIKIEIESVFEILKTSMENKFIYAMLALFKTIEIIIGLYIEEKKENNKRFAYWKNTNIKLKFVDKDEYFPKELPLDSQPQKYNDSTINKIRVLCYERLDLTSKDFHDNLAVLVNFRNETVHPPIGRVSQKPSKINIQEWFKMIQMILNKI